jgi:hypothetical protein
MMFALRTALSKSVHAYIILDAVSRCFIPKNPKYFLAQEESGRWAV